MDDAYIQKLIQIRNKVEEMNKTSHVEVLKILKKYNNEYSENKNGVFVNLSMSNKDVIEAIEEYIKYYNTQEQVITDIENEKHNIEKSYFSQS